MILLDPVANSGPAIILTLRCLAIGSALQSLATSVERAALKMQRGRARDIHATMYQFPLHCTNSRYIVPILVTMYQFSLQCTNSRYIVPILVTMYQFAVPIICPGILCTTLEYEVIPRYLEQVSQLCMSLLFSSSRFTRNSFGEVMNCLLIC